MDSRLSALTRSRRTIVSISKKLSWVFAIAFALYCIVFISIALLILFAPVGYDVLAPTCPFAWLPVFCSILSGGLALFVLTILFRCIGRGESPFTKFASTQFIVIGAVLLLGVVSEALIAPGTAIGVADGVAAMAVEYNQNPASTVHIDVKGFIVSISCFALSAIFRYGAILQCEADDLM